MKWKAVAAAILLAGGVGAAVFVVVTPGGTGSVQYLTSAATRTTVARQAVASGSIVSKATYDLAFGASPSAGATPAAGGGGGAVWLVKSVRVKLGDRVTKGTVLATADRATALAALQVAEANLAAARAVLALDSAGPTAAARAAAANAVAQAQQQLRVAHQGQLEAARTNALNQRQAQGALRVATAKLATDRAAWLPLATVQADQSAVAQAQQQLATVALQNRASDSQAAQTRRQNALQLRQAQAAVHDAQSKLAADQAAGPPPATIQADQAAVTQAQQQLATLNLQNQAAASQASSAVEQASLKVNEAQIAVQGAQATLAADQAAAAKLATLQADLAGETQAQQQLNAANLDLQGATTAAGQTAQMDALKLSQAQAALQAATATLAADRAARPPAATIQPDQAAITTARQQVDTLRLSIRSSDALAVQTSRMNALKLRQAQAAVRAAATTLAADRSAGPAAATIQADQAAITTARQQLDAMKLAARSSGTQATDQLASARLALAAAKTAYVTGVVGASPSVLASDLASLQGSQQAVGLARQTVAGATLRSPVDGVVVAVNVFAGGVAPSSVDAVVAKRAFQVNATVTETDLPSVKVGQAATLRINALGVTAAGTVIAISPQGSVSGSTGVVSYPIAIALHTPPPGTTAGMSAQVAVVIAQAKNVLAVPAIALNGSAGHYVVRVLDASGRPHDRSVGVGLVTASLAQITSGLAAGDLVVTGTTAPRSGASAAGGSLQGLLPAGGGGGGGGNTGG